MTWRLLGGGPVNVPDYVADAVARCAIGHRDPPCVSLIRNISNSVCALAGAKADDFAVIPIAGSGTAGNEMVLSSVVKDGDTVLVLANGEFGYRLHPLSGFYNKTEMLDFGWGNTFDCAAVADAIDRHSPTLVAMVHHETSTGILNPVAEVGRICAEKGVRLLVDVVSSLGADVVDLEGWNATFASATSGKSIGAMPGIAMVFARRDAVAAILPLPRRGHYLNLATAYQAIEETGITRNTPAVNLLAGLDAALRGIESEGHLDRLLAIRQRTDYLRESLLADGWELYFPDAVRSYAGTCVKLPQGLGFADFAAALAEHRFTVHGGKGPFADVMFQVCCSVGVDNALIDEFCDTIAVIRQQFRPLEEVQAVVAG